MHRSVWLTLIIVFIPIISSTSKSLYVVPFPTLIDNKSDGTLKYPYSSLQQALDHTAYDITRRTTIYLYPTHHFVDTLHLNQSHSHLRITTMNDEDVAFYRQISNRSLSTASISGGVPITGWTSVGNNTFKATVSQPNFVNQLFVNNRRVVRARLPTNYSEYLQFAAPLSDPNSARYGFQYADGQFDSWVLDDAMVVVYHSWTTSHHYIDRLIPSNRTILFTNPSGAPIGTYTTQGQRRFHVENMCSSLIANSFCFVNTSKTVYLMTDGSYDPNQVQIITPVSEFVVSIVGESINQTVDDIIIDNVAIQHSAWNIERTQQADYQAAAFLTSAPLYIVNATSIVISDVEISHTGSYGIWIQDGTTNINVLNSLVTDTGAGGIRIGQMQSPVIFPTNSINIISNEISYGGNVFPSGVGLITHRANDVTIADNSIHHQRYTGVSIGWEWGYSTSYTSNIFVQGNYIYNTGEHILCDQGGIYTLGLQPGTVIHGNVIKNVFSYAAYMWGVYLDEGSTGIVVSNNIVYNIGWAGLFQHYGANNTIINNVFARTSLIDPPQSGDPIPDGDLRIMLTENHLSWLFTRNIVYDIYQGSNHSLFKSDAPNVTVEFNNNVYFNPLNTTLLFGIEQTSFEQWQKTGQDNNSVIADPLFIGDVNQCDFFTVQEESPAAKLGFSNITKPARWTPGCNTDELTSRNKNFYHW